jgi:hypothetical protein
MHRSKAALTRRSFLQTSLGTGAFMLGGSGQVLSTEFVEPQSSRTTEGTPWYRRAYLWGQTNITEKDPERYDIARWRNYWKRTGTQAVIINAGGIVAYYPSRFPLHTDFFGRNNAAISSMRRTPASCTRSSALAFRTCRSTSMTWSSRAAA